MIPEDLKKPKKGGRPSNHSLLLTQAEYEWCQRKAVRKASLIPKATQSSPALKKIIEALDDKFSMAPEPDEKGRIPMKLSKEEVSVLQTLVDLESQTLSLVVNKMFERNLTEHSRYTEAITKMRILCGLHEKINKRLGNK